ncbi:hypothetical protein SODALDRAFT_363463 [Sodiomyces alkalinus F11]|uniref:Uncharacterized protein n=1 Tax=Sodiomyces alkalinus (strain CBS 110278 / VKM F-3762 / F11) TaxID=1314773 RepID=A0A3N2PM45_SODAK|nr:hypothetical protein SODALDRAFT_363463 [Sodiomyces alkalinus F11]ROT35605.1 hypothetical protein SODALDRAFT_363463 [Sodiomyces alkalinus F11]
MTPSITEGGPIAPYEGRDPTRPRFEIKPDSADSSTDFYRRKYFAAASGDGVKVENEIAHLLLALVPHPWSFFAFFSNDPMKFQGYFADTEPLQQGSRERERAQGTLKSSRLPSDEPTSRTSPAHHSLSPRRSDTLIQTLIEAANANSLGTRQVAHTSCLLSRIDRHT